MIKKAEKVKLMKQKLLLIQDLVTYLRKLRIIKNNKLSQLGKSIRIKRKKRKINKRRLETNKSKNNNIFRKKKKNQNYQLIIKMMETNSKWTIMMIDFLN